MRTSRWNKPAHEQGRPTFQNKNKMQCNYICSTAFLKALWLNKMHPVQSEYQFSRPCNLLATLVLGQHVSWISDLQSAAISAGF